MTSIHPNTLEKFPSVFLHKHNGSSQAAPVEIMARIPTKFKLIPLTEEGNIIEPEETFLGRQQYLSEMRQWMIVAIFCEKRGGFLSCEKKKNIPGMRYSSTVECRPTIGSSERFEFQHFAKTESFAFRSHNGLYLTNNRKRLGSIILRSESRKEGSTIVSHRSWEITPVLNFSSSDQRIKFVGVIDNSMRVAMKLQLPNEDQEEQNDEEELPVRSCQERSLRYRELRGRSSLRSFEEQSIGSYYQHTSQSYDQEESLSRGRSSLRSFEEQSRRSYYQHTSGSYYQEESLRDNTFMRHAAHSVLGDVLAEGLRRGESTRFCTHNGDSHYYVRDKDGVVYMVVASQGFLRALAGECVNDLRILYKKFFRGQTKRMLRIKQNKNKRIQNELEFLIWNYNEYNESFCRNPLRKTICNQMEDAIDGVLDCCMENTHAASERVQRLREISHDFRTDMRKVRARQISKWFAVQAGKVGALVLKFGLLGLKRPNKPLMWQKYVPSPSYGIQ